MHACIDKHMYAHAAIYTKTTIQYVNRARDLDLIVQYCSWWRCYHYLQKYTFGYKLISQLKGKPIYDHGTLSGCMPHTESTAQPATHNSCSQTCLLIMLSKFSFLVWAGIWDVDRASWMRLGLVLVVFADQASWSNIDFIFSLWELVGCFQLTIAMML